MVGFRHRHAEGQLDAVDSKLVGQDVTADTQVAGSVHAVPVLELARCAFLASRGRLVPPHESPARVLPDGAAPGNIGGWSNRIGDS